MMAATVTFRLAEEKDSDFLSEVYASTRLEELQVTGWPQQQIDEFLRMQFEAQDTFYKQQFPDAHYQIVQYESQDAGRLYLDFREDEVRIVDIALLPEYRGKGLGTKLLNSIIDDAAEKQLNVRIHVEKNNPALNLYLRLGFEKTDDKGVYWLMEKPAQQMRCAG